MLEGTEKIPQREQGNSKHQFTFKMKEETTSNPNPWVF